MMTLEWDSTRSFAYEIILFVFCFFTIILNGLVLWVTATRSKRDRAIDSQLINLIATFDTFVAIILGGSQIYRWSSHQAHDNLENGIWCTLSAVLLNATSFIALGLTAQLSIIRYLAIVKGYAIKNYKSTVASISVIVFFVVLFIATRAIGVSRLMPSTLYCIPTTEPRATVGHTIYTLVIFLIIAPVILSIPVFYGLVSLHYYNLSVKMRMETDGLRKIAYFPHSRHIYYLFAFTFVYLLSLMPQLILLIVEAASDFKRDYIMDCVTLFLIFSGSLINPLFVLTLHPESRSKLVSLFKRDSMKERPVDIDVDRYRMHSGSQLVNESHFSTN
ncbi:family A G protein-coupled receptor-like protein [Neoconidiobolus thromboides FSU 785]|nr:family A G protein-coupled receptor-like protein [Neoconidiobolus thromboides FSU 785]